jgi:CheY-like chemotaxis protein
MADLLVVDDDPDVGELLVDLFTIAGHGCRVAHNGQEGLDLVAVRAPDLLLLDVEMPVLDGPEMAYRLYMRDAGDEKIPIILVSGCVELSSIAATVGTPYYLTKPTSFENMQRLVDRALVERIPPRPAKAACS